MTYPTDLSAVTDNVDDVLAAHVNNIEEKLGVDGSAVATTIDYLLKNSINFRSRTTPSSVDIDADGTETAFADWDVQSVVGTKAVRVKLWVWVKDDNVNSFIGLRKNGEGDDNPGLESIRVYCASTSGNSQEVSVECDASQVIEWMVQDGSGGAIAEARITVVGWWETVV